jgi:aryl sulfotransferase
MSKSLPEKNAEQQWAVWDSTRLNDFPFRDDDIIIGTWSKSGTTWMQQLVAQLVFQGDPEAYGQGLSPWPEFRLLPKEDVFAIAEAQTHRRFIKTHSPINCVPFRPEMKYLFIGRDARDVAWSMYNHHKLINQKAFDMFNNAPGLVGEPFVPLACGVHEYYLSFLEKGHFDCQSNAPFWPCIQSWWDVREQPNIMLLHYNNLKTDFEGEARRVAEFLEIEVAEETWPAIVKHCHIDYMRELAIKLKELEIVFEGGGANFINKGSNERWKDVLSQEEINRCDDIAIAELGEECARWLKTGELS